MLHNSSMSNPLVQVTSCICVSIHLCYALIGRSCVCHLFQHDNPWGLHSLIFCTHVHSGPIYWGGGIYFAYTCVRDLFIGGGYYLAKRIIR